jgi:Tol biopolymer transport system component
VGGADADIMMASADGSGTPAKLTNTPGKSELSPQISPDGRKLVYTVYSGDPEKSPGVLKVMDIANPGSALTLSVLAYRGFWAR